MSWSRDCITGFLFFIPMHMWMTKSDYQTLRLYQCNHIIKINIIQSLTQIETNAEHLTICKIHMQAYTEQI